MTYDERRRVLTGVTQVSIILPPGCEPEDLPPPPPADDAPNPLQSLIDNVLGRLGEAEKLKTRLKQQAAGNGRIIWNPETDAMVLTAARVAMLCAHLEDALHVASTAFQCMMNSASAYARQGQQQPVAINMKQPRPTQTNAANALIKLGLPIGCVIFQTGPAEEKEPS